MLFYKRIDVLTLYLVITVLILNILCQTQARLFKVMSVDRPNEPCILLDINFTIQLKAFVGTQEVASAVKTSNDQEIDVRGSCDNINSVLSLRFANKTTWTLRFKQISGKVELNRLIQFEPIYVFGEKVPDLSVLTMDDPGITDLFSSQDSYICSVPEITEYGEPFSTGAREFNFSIVTNVSSIHAQAFNVKEGEFSRARNCRDTNDTTPQTSTTTPVSGTTTPSSTSTTTPEPITSTTSAPFDTTTFNRPNVTVSPMPYVSKFTVKDGNVTCIVLQGNFSIVIKYKANKTSGTETRSTRVEIPADAESTGNCDPSTSIQTLGISFYDGWLLEFAFYTNEELGETVSREIPKIKYRISNVTLTYRISEQRFQDSVTPFGTVVTVVPSAEEPDFPKKSKNAGFYKCINEVEMKITDDVEVLTTNLEFMAFNQNNNSTFVGGVDECAADKSTDSTVPIVVGCVFAGMAVLAASVYAYIRYRKNKKMRAYEEI